MGCGRAEYWNEVLGVEMLCGQSWAPLRIWPCLSVYWRESPEMLCALRKHQKEQLTFLSQPRSSQPSGTQRNQVLEPLLQNTYWWELGEDASLSHSLKVSLGTISAVHRLTDLPFKLFLSFFLLATPDTCESSQARDQTHTTAVTRATAVTMLDP